MASPSSSSSSSKRNQPVWKTPVTWNTKRYQTINDYINSYFTGNPLRPQLNKPPPSFNQQTSDSDTPTHSRSENRSRTRNKTEAEKINELAKEMDKMLSKAKSKRQTNDLLRLFKNTLNNFIVPEHPMDNTSNPHEINNYNLKHEKQMSSPSSSMYQPMYHHHYHHHHHQHKPEETINESNPSDHNLFSDHETSMTMTTTTTRREIKDPSKSVIESSKTNILHRCYGKQSVKALPQIHKSRKKNNSNVTNCQRPPPVIKIKSIKSPKLLQSKTPNQQMKTIYENEKYDKSKKSINKNVNDIDVIIIENSSSISSVDTDKHPIVETHVNNENITFSDNDKKLSKDFMIPKTIDNRKHTSKSTIITEIDEQEVDNIINKDSKQTKIDLKSEQDNSIVQRLTTFWNKKLNTLGESKSSTDQSSINNSSLTSIFEEDDVKKDDDQDTTNKSSITNLKLEEENFNEYNEKQNENVEFEKNSVDDIEFIDSRIKLKENRSTINNSFNKKPINNKDKTNLVQNDSGLPNLKMGFMDELLRVLQNRDEAVTQSKIRNNDDKIINNEISRENEVNSELNCLVTKDSQNAVTMNETDDKPSDYDEEEEEDIDIIYQCDEQTIEAIEKCLLDNMINENTTRDVEDYFKPQCKITKVKNVKENDEASKSHENNITNFNEHSSVITNVNSIITNLKKLINTIESIPDELKCVDMNLNCLPIPDKIKRKISTLIITPDNEADVDKQLSPLQTANITDNNQLFQCYSSGKLIGYTKQEGYTYTLYFPKVLTLPIIENVKNQFHKIQFPKRNEYLKCNNQMAVSITEITDLISEDGCIKDKKDEDMADLISKNENFKENTERVDKRIMEITNIETRTTQSSIIYVTSPPSSTNTALKYLNKSSDNIHKEPRKTILFKPCKITTVFPSENLNNISKVQFEKNVCAESNSISNTNSFEELSDDGTSGVSFAVSNTNQQEEFNERNITNTVENDTFPKESRINLEEIRPISPNDLSTLHRRYNNMRRRRRLQNHIEEDNAILAGGSGDSMQNCGDGSTPIPCHHTSSMSVVVSNSVNDTNSQPDINIVESESNLCRLRLNGHHSMNIRPQPTQDSDNFSTCGVIQEEGSDEQLSDIDDCVMIEQHNNSKKENRKEDSYDTISSSTISSQNTTMARTSEQEVDISQDSKVECSNSDKRQVNEKCCDDQFTYQNLRNMIHEETVSLLSRNLTNSLEQENNTSQNHNLEQKETEQMQLNNKDSENGFSYRNLNVVKVETITKVTDELTKSQSEIKQTSFVSENIYPENNYSNTSLLQQDVTDLNDSNNYDNSSNTTSSSNSNHDISDQDDNSNNNNNEHNTYENINKTDFHRNYPTFYFETEISEEAEHAIKNKLIQNNSKIDLEILFEKDPFLKTELSNITDINNLTEKEKQLIVACINFMTCNNNDKQQSHPTLSRSINDLSLKLCLNILLNKTSQVISTQIELAKKTLIPYESNTLLYHQCFRKLMKAFYTLFISLVLIVIIQKNFFGILLPVRFPW